MVVGCNLFQVNLEELIFRLALIADMIMEK
jgi:hypothetical protein